MSPVEAWITREVLTRAGLTETMPDFTAEGCEPLATGYSGKAADRQTRDGKPERDERPPASCRLRVYSS